jgi:vancomycin resistance protein YoaR
LLSRAAALGLVIILVLVVTAFQVRERDLVRSHVSAFGVDLGGMDRDEARQALVAEQQARGRQVIELVDQTGNWAVNQQDLGLVLDIDTALDDAFQTGREGFGPGRLALVWKFRRDNVEVGMDNVAVVSPTLDAQLNAIAAEIDQPMIAPELTIDSAGAVHYVSAQTGRVLDVAASRQAVLTALSLGETEVELVVNETPPPATDEQYAEAYQRAQRVLDAPIVVEANGETWTFEPPELAAWLGIEPPSGSRDAELVVHEGWVSEVVDEIGFAIDRDPQSTHLWWDVGGNLIVTKPGSPGYEVVAEQSIALLLDAFEGVTEENRVILPVTVSDPSAPPADLNSLGLQSVIAEASTPYGGGYPARVHNIELAATLLNGTLILPGQTFSFNAEIGPMTLDAGFQMAFGITAGEDGLRTIPAEAGGICQVATTVFQPVFAAGYQIEERHTHSYWIPNYNFNGMAGLDATVDPPSGLDFRWTNNSGNAVLLVAEADGEHFTIRLVGTPPNWSVELQEPKIENIVQADKETINYEANAEIEPGKIIRVEHANDGFDVTITRIVREGENERVFEAKTTYAPSRNVFLVGSENGELPADFVPPDTATPEPAPEEAPPDEESSGADSDASETPAEGETSEEGT